MTSVGGTTGFPETAVEFSGGGFSDVFPRPSYQDEAISAYLESLGDTNADRFNAYGRGFPDIAAIATDAEIVYQGQTVRIGGTSLSTPLFAAILALLNDELESAGRSRLGFLNPWLCVLRFSVVR